MTERYICCSKCGGHIGTLKKIGDDKYAHQKEQDCIKERKRVKDKNNLVIARSRIILPRGLKG